MSHFLGNTGTLIIVVSRAKDIPDRRKMEKQNPYCLMRISNLTDKTTVDIRGGQNPSWDQEFRFNITPEIQPILKLSILDETKKAPVLVSEAEIDITPVFYSSVKEGFDKWHQLKSGSWDGGQIYLEMTFYPAVSGLGSSQVRKPTKRSPMKKRILPAIPGQEEREKPVCEPVDTIPPPIARAGTSSTIGYDTFVRSQFDLSQMSSSNQLYHSDSFRPQSSNDFSRSHMSVTSLPDVPTHNNITKELPPLNIRLPSKQSSELQRSPGTSSLSDSLDPGRQQRSTPDFKTFAKKLTNKYNIPLFGSDENVSEKSTLDSFDELEREVQSDYIRNHRSERERAPPLPSHSQKSLSSGSGSLPPPLPHHSSGSLKTSSINQYNIIEPEGTSRLSPERRKSPERKAPGGFYKSGSSSPTRLNLNNLPYDANNIPSPSNHHPTIQNYNDRITSSNDGNVLLDSYNASTTYDMFVQNTLNQSQNSASSSFSRSSPTRFKSSLPPPPPPH